MAGVDDFLFVKMSSNKYFTKRHTMGASKDRLPNSCYCDELFEKCENAAEFALNSLRQNDKSIQ